MLCCSQNSIPDTLAFSKYLIANHLLVEQIALNKKQQIIYSEKQDLTDSLHLYLALAYMQLPLIDSSKKALFKISRDFNFSGKNNQLYISLLIVNKEYGIAKELFSFRKNLALPEVYRSETDLSLKILTKELPKNDSTYNTSVISPTILELKNRYDRQPHYSPLLSGVYSAVIPGLGKLYVGNKYQAITAFIANALLASQTAESYIKAGASSPRFIITASIFGIFYAGNIWGSVLLAKKKKNDYLTQIDYEIFDYYRADINKFNY